MFDVIGFKNWVTQAQAVRREQGKQLSVANRIGEWSLRRGDIRREERLRRMQQTRRRDLQALWKIATQEDSWAQQLRTVLGIVLALSPLLISCDSSSVGFERVLLFVAITSTSVVILGRDFALLAQCLPTLNMELLRPATRDEWRKTWFQGVGIRSTFLLAAAVGNGWIWLYRDRSGLWSWLEGVLLTFLLVGCVTALFGTVMLSITYLTEFRFLPTLFSMLLLLICMLSFVMLFLAKPLLTEFLRDQRFLKSESVSILLSFNISAWLLAGLMCGLAWRRWWSWELGNLKV